MPYKCCIENCKQQLPLRKFPKNKEMFNIWKERIGHPRFSTLGDKSIATYYKICSKHFLDECITHDGILRKRALPTKFLLNFSDEPSVENSYYIYPDVEVEEHNYKINEDKDNNAASSSTIINEHYNMSDLNLCVMSSNVQCTISTDVKLEFNPVTTSQSIFNNIWNGTIKLPSEFWSHSKIMKDESKYAVFTKYTISQDLISIVEKQVFVDSNLSIKYIVMQELYKNDNMFPKISSLLDFENMLVIFNDLNLCGGGPKLDLYPQLLLLKTKIAYPDNKYKVWRHTKCPILIKITKQCDLCKTLFKTLDVYKIRQKLKSKEQTNSLNLRRIITNQNNVILKTKVMSLNEQLVEIKKTVGNIEVSNMEKNLDELDIPNEQKISIREF